MTTYHLARMTRDEIAEQIRRKPVAILPIGATEQHGHHLPLGTDNYLAEELAGRIAEEVDGVVLPTIPFGYSFVWRDIPGTITVGHRTLELYLRDVIESVERSGFGALAIVDGHESNVTTMKYVVRDYAETSAFPVIRLFYPDFAEIRAASCKSATWYGMIHACEFETSLMLEAEPELVDMRQAVAEYPDFSDSYTYAAEQLGNLSASGVYGDATLATVEKGQVMFARFVHESVRVIHQLTTAE